MASTTEPAYDGPHEWEMFLETLVVESRLKYQRCVADYLEYCNANTKVMNKGLP